MKQEKEKVFPGWNQSILCSAVYPKVPSQSLGVAEREICHTFVQRYIFWVWVYLGGSQTDNSFLPTINNAMITKFILLFQLSLTCPRHVRPRGRRRPRPRAARRPPGSAGGDLSVREHRKGSNFTTLSLWFMFPVNLLIVIVVLTKR